MKITINILLHRMLCLSALMFLVVGCSDDLRYTSGNLSDYEVREVEVPVMFDVESMISADPPTRSSEDRKVDAELRIHDFWLLQFDPEGKRVTKPYYHLASDGDHVPMVVPVKENVKFRCVVLANTGDPTFFNLENTQNFDQIKNLPVQDIKGGPFFRADKAYCVVEDGIQYPLMSGESKVDYRTNGLETALRCYFAQVLLHFKFDEQFKDEDFDRIKGIRVVNVPKKYRYTGELYHPYNEDYDLYQNSSEYPGSILESEERKDYTTFEIVIPEDASYRDLWGNIKTTRGFDCIVYLPRRLALPFEAINTLVDETGIQFQFTLENDPENDPDDNSEELGYQTVNIVKSHDQTSTSAKREILPRTKYELTILVKELTNQSLGDATFTDEGNVDTFEPFENPTILAYANSFMINPDKMHDQDFKIPLSRIDQFYFVSSVSSAYTYYKTDLDRTGELSNKYGGNYEYPLAIDSETEWTAEILWQDTPERLIYFIDPEHNGQVDYKAINAGGHSGKGTTFAPVWDTWLNEGGFCFRPTGAKGNLVIGIRKKYVEDYDFWGFHHGYFPYYDGTLPDDNNKQYLWCFHLWFTDYEPEGDVMDRNLGAMSADDPGLYYYSNRKDPVPYATALYGKQVYDHLGNPSDCIKIGGTPPVAGPYDSGADYQMMVDGPDWPNGWGGENKLPFFGPYGFLRMAEMEWAYYYLRHPLIFQKNTEGYWFSPETKYNIFINDDDMVWADLHPYYNAGNSIYHWLDRLLNEDESNIKNEGTSHSKMLTQMELPMAEEPINRKSMFDPCPPGWRLPEYISDIQGNTRNMKGKYWTNTYNFPTPYPVYNVKGEFRKYEYDVSDLKTNGIKGKVLNVNGGSVTESYEKLATFLPVRCVRHVPLNQAPEEKQ